MKNFALFVFSVMLLQMPLSAQQGDLFIKSGTKGFFIEHTTAAKENFFSIGRLYHVHPRFIASYNSLDMNKGLNLGQLLLIPLNDSNFSQQVNKGAPVFYKAGEKETLGKIGSVYKVPVEKLRLWNKLTGDNVVAGKKLIVGFLISGELPVLKEMVINNDKPSVVKSENKKPDDPEVKKETEPKKEEVKVNTINREEINKKEPVFTKNNEEIKIKGNDEGFFSSHFTRQVKVYPVLNEATVTSGIFKTIYGWQDKKYFILIDKVEPGLIVKITNPSNNKIIYAKVLYGMEGILQNKGLDIRISNAAATALGITDTDKFILKVNY